MEIQKMRFINQIEKLKSIAILIAMLFLFSLQISCSESEKDIKLLSKIELKEDSAWVLHSVPLKLKVKNDSLLYFIVHGKGLIEYNYKQNRISNKIFIKEHLDYNRISKHYSEKMNLNYVSENEFDSNMMPGISKYEISNFTYDKKNMLIISINVTLYSDKLLDKNQKILHEGGYSKFSIIEYLDENMQIKNDSMYLPNSELPILGTTFLFESINDTIFCNDNANSAIGSNAIIYLVREKEKKLLTNSYNILLDDLSLSYAYDHIAQFYILTLDSANKIIFSDGKKIRDKKNNIIFTLDKNEKADIRYLREWNKKLYIQTISREGTKIFSYNLENKKSKNVLKESPNFRVIDIYKNKLISIVNENQKYYLEEYELE